MVAQAVGQHTGCGYALGGYMARMLHTVVMDKHIVLLLDIGTLDMMVHVVDIVVEFQNMLKTTPSFQYRTVRYSNISVPGGGASCGPGAPYGGVLNCAVSWEFPGASLASLGFPILYLNYKS